MGDYDDELREQIIASLQKDAARYRWLRAQCDKNLGFWWAVSPPVPAAAITSPEELDQVIDRASARETEGDAK